MFFSQIGGLNVLVLEPLRAGVSFLCAKRVLRVNAPTNATITPHIMLVSQMPIAMPAITPNVMPKAALAFLFGFTGSIVLLVCYTMA